MSIFGLVFKPALTQTNPVPLQCDLQKPFCRTCTKTGRVCEGYSRYPVFVNRTLTGLAKRERLEEAKPGSSHDLNAGEAQPVVLRELTSRNVDEAQVISWFWESYAPPTRPADAREGYAGWLYYAISVPWPLPALRQSLLALAVTKYGRAVDNNGMFQQGRKIYSDALSLLQQALYNHQTVWDDETLATVRSLVLYEFLESTSEDPTAWYSHLDGIERLMQARGSQRHTANMARAVLDDIRYPLMMKAIMQRKGSVFGEPHWLSGARSTEQSIDQLVYDHGFQLAALLERVDGVRATSLGRERFTVAIQTLRDLNGLHQSLQNLYDHQLAVIPVQEWRRIERLILVLNVYAMQLRATFVMRTFLENVGTANQTSFAMNAETQGVLEEAADHMAGQESLVRRMYDGVKLSMDESLGQYGPSRTIFPLNLLLWYFRQSEAEFKEVCAMKRTVVAQKGLKFMETLTRDEPTVSLAMQDAAPSTEQGKI